MNSYMSPPSSAHDDDAAQPAPASLIDLAGARLDRAAQTEGPAGERDRQLTQFFASVVEHANDLVVVIDERGQISLVNDAGRTLLGIAGPLTGEVRPLEFVAPQDRAAVREAVRRTHGTGAPVRVTARVVPHNDDPLPVDLQLTCVAARNGRSAHLIVIGGDARERIARDRQLAERALRADRHMAEHAALHRIASGAARGDEFEQVMNDAASEIVQLLDTDCALIGRFADRQCVVVGLHDPHPRLIAGDCIALEQSVLLRRVCDEDLTGRIDSYARLNAVTGITPPPLGFTASVAAPIHIDDRVWGVVMAATRDGGRFPDDTEGQLSRVAKVVAIAVTADQTRERLASQALTDALTGLPNHRAFQERLSIEVSRSRRYGRPVSLAILDLDHFKRLNDAHGHPMGDAILVEVGHRLTSCVRRDEMIARIGGEEFAWILPEADLATAAEAIERARRTVSATPMPQGIAISLSAGVCDLDTAHGSTDELVRMADSALYWASRMGGTRPSSSLRTRSRASRPTNVLAASSATSQWLRCARWRGRSTRRTPGPWPTPSALPTSPATSQPDSGGPRPTRFACVTRRYCMTSARLGSRTRSYSSTGASSRTSSTRSSGTRPSVRRSGWSHSTTRSGSGFASTTSAGTGRATPTAWRATTSPRAHASSPSPTRGMS